MACLIKDAKDNSKATVPKIVFKICLSDYGIFQDIFELSLCQRSVKMVAFGVDTYIHLHTYAWSWSSEQCDQEIALRCHMYTMPSLPPAVGVEKFCGLCTVFIMLWLESAVFPFNWEFRYTFSFKNLLEKGTVAQEIPWLLWIPKVYYCVRKSPPPYLSRTGWIQFISPFTFCS